MSETHHCHCRQCFEDRPPEGPYGPLIGFIACLICGNKRCPHATDHRHACTDSNAPGQTGSVYGDHELRRTPVGEV